MLDAAVGSSTWALGETSRSHPFCGRERELAGLRVVVDRARSGRSGALVVTGEAGIGKTALLEAAVAAYAGDARVERIVAAETELELPYAGLHQLCHRMLEHTDALPDPQRDALEAALGARSGVAPSPFLVGLALLGLLAEAAGGHSLLYVVDDAHWLDDVSRRVLAFAARRLHAEGIALVLAVRQVPDEFVGLERLTLDGLTDDAARELLRIAMPGTIDRRVRDQLIAEAQGNPLALRELPRTLTPADLAGGFALIDCLPLEHRIEESVLAQLAPLPDEARTALLLAAADPTGDAALLWRASAILELAPSAFDAAERSQALRLGGRVGFRHPLVRSAVYRTADAAQRRRVHAALAEATEPDLDPDRRAWHRACATVHADEDVAADLERSAGRARSRGGAAAAAHFLQRAAELTPAAACRAQRLLDAAQAKHEAGAPERALDLLVIAQDLALTPLQEALGARLQAEARYALRRDRGAARELFAAAERLAPLDPARARDAYLSALTAAVYAGRLGHADDLRTIARGILATPSTDQAGTAGELMLRGQALLIVEGLPAAADTLRRALRAYAEQPLDDLEVRWAWLARQAAIDLWDADALRALAEPQVEFVRRRGVLETLPAALTFVMAKCQIDGDLSGFSLACDEVDVIQGATRSLRPNFGRVILAALRGRQANIAPLTAALRRHAEVRGEGTALSVANYAEAIAANGAGRFRDAVTMAQRERTHLAEYGFAGRTLSELVEGAVRIGAPELAADGLEQLAAITRPVGGDWALGTLALASAQLATGAAAHDAYEEAVERARRARLTLIEGRARLLFGEALRRQGMRADARLQLREAHAILDGCGAEAFAERAARELAATGEAVRTHVPRVADALTEQELNVAQLARDGLTNRDIGARLFISARTAEYHLRKVFLKLGIASRAQLTQALGDQV